MFESSGVPYSVLTAVKWLFDFKSKCNTYHVNLFIVVIWGALLFLWLWMGVISLRKLCCIFWALEHVGLFHDPVAAPPIRGSDTPKHIGNTSGQFLLTSSWVAVIIKD